MLELYVVFVSQVQCLTLMYANTYGSECRMLVGYFCIWGILSMVPNV